MSGTAQQVFDWGGGDAKEECAKEIFLGGGEAGRGGGMLYKARISQFADDTTIITNSRLPQITPPNC